MKTARSTFLDIRRLRTHVREWGRDGDPLLVLLHGWMDVSASFQFMVGALVGRWHVIAPDWRGFGLTARPTASPGVDGYWFPDYLADLDTILLRYAGVAETVHLVGHSMGGNIACLYAGVRPERVATLVSLEGFGLPRTKPEWAPARYAKWLDELRSPPTMTTYATREDVARRLMKNNPRLGEARAAFLAEHWAAPDDAGRFAILGDPAHKMANPMLYRIEEVLACWRAITAPVLWVAARDSDSFALWTKGDPAKEARLRADHAERLKAIAQLREVIVDDAGHMVHHDQPARCAQLIEAFIAEQVPRGQAAA